MADEKPRPEAPNQNNITQDGDPAGKAEPTVEQLRGDIDAGRTGDKVGHPDPATAPLGADAEAGGASPTNPEVAQARAEEVSRPDAPRADPGRPVSSEPAPAGGRPQMIWWAVAAIVVVVLLFALF